MMHLIRSHAAYRAAVLLLAVTAAACSDAPTAVATDARITPGAQGPALNAAAVITVSNSGGTPLVSWGAVSGATSYTVNLLRYRTFNGQYQGRTSGFLTSTTGTSYLDTGRSYTGVYECSDEGPNGQTTGFWLEYEVVSHFATGTTSARRYAPVAECY